LFVFVATNARIICYSSQPPHHTQTLRAKHQTQIPMPYAHAPAPHLLPYTLYSLLHALCPMPYAPRPMPPKGS